MSQWLAEQTSSILESRSSRRGFLVRTAVVGSALTVSPLRYLLRPGTAYAAVCRCANQSCTCGSACCDGYTEFCCTITGANVCPGGTFAGGWWKADGTSFCGGAARYYIDCNMLPGHGCGCGCAGFNCNNRKTCCTAFRYGQCNQGIPGVTPIRCRVVSCTPPWQLDGTCTRSSATDNATAGHHAACLNPPPPPRLPIGRRTMTYGFWYLRNSNSTGSPDGVFRFGNPGDIPIVGDWNGDGLKTVGVVRGNTWLLRNSNTTGDPDIVFQYGNPGDIPIVGDWNGDGIDTPGVVQGGNIWALRNSNTTGFADGVFQYGNPGDIPIVGDWNGDGLDTAGVVQPGGVWALRNSNSTGYADGVFRYGNPGDDPIVGDWNGDGLDTAGVVQGGGVWALRNSNSTGNADGVFRYGDYRAVPVVGDWNGDGLDTAGVAL
ncbi:MAG: hypothetical protein M3378_11245 [Actinomycetota bacterium]|nr:hypothetical protein [Actinomycetota bacterium]